MCLKLLTDCFYLFLFIEIHHKQHINYRSLEFKILKINLLRRGKKDRHLQLPYSMIKANKNNKNRQNKFRKNLGQQIPVATGEPRSSQFLFQRLSVAVQRGNAACVVGTVPGSCGLEDFFYIEFLIKIK